MSLRQRQRGVVLVTVILIIAMVTVAAVALAARQQVDIRRSANVLNRDQAYAFALGAESWARLILTRDLAKGAADDLEEDWATLLPPIGVEGGTLSATLEDLQGRFNVNNLAQQGNAGTLALQQFQRLLGALELDEGLAYAVRDWLDDDGELYIPGGAEDSDYLTLTPPYRTANAMMRSTSELLAVRGMSAAAYQKLAPHISALPEATPVNVNTATPLVLSAMIKDLPLGAAEAVVEARSQKAFANLEAFLQDKTMAGIKIGEDEVQALAVSSHYFLLHGQADFGRGHIRLYSMLSRQQPGMVQVVMRSEGVI